LANDTFIFQLVKALKGIGHCDLSMWFRTESLMAAIYITMNFGIAPSLPGAIFNIAKGTTFVILPRKELTFFLIRC